MRIWLITVGEPLPIDGPNERFYRAGIIANMLIKRGHKVVWWSSTFDHVKKKQRFNTDTSVNVNNRYNIRLMHSLAYKKNISAERIINHYMIAHKFSKLAELEVQPDIILCSYPTIGLSLVATKYGKRKNVPVIIDVRDLWPDNFLDMVPIWGRWLAKIILIPILKKTRVVYKSATGIVGLTSDFVEWGINYANRKHSNLDREFPMGYTETPPNQKAIMKAKKFWDNYGINQKNNEFIVCFFGTMSRQFDLKTIIKTAQKLMFQKTLFRFVLCGNGDNLTFYKDIAKNCKNVVFPGWVGAAEIWTLMRISHIGLAPYVNIKNFTMNLPNKPIEYLSAGLPIVSSLKEGVLKDLLNNYNCGVTYKNADELASILINLFNHPELLKEMSKNAYTLYRDKFVAEKVYNHMIDYLELVVKNYKKN